MFIKINGSLINMDHVQYVEASNICDKDGKPTASKITFYKDVDNYDSIYSYPYLDPDYAEKVFRNLCIAIAEAEKVIDLRLL